MSIEGVRNDLLGLGYENPTICPLSAYFSLLIKMRQNGETLTGNESDEFELYAKKFSRPKYDLSRYYAEPRNGVITDKDDLTVLAIKCGLYGLEKYCTEE